MQKKNGLNLARIATQTLVLLQQIRKTNIGDKLSYESLSNLAGCDVRPNMAGYGYLYRARRLAEQEGVFFAAIMKTDDFHGIQRLSDAEALGTATRGRRSIRRRARLESRRLAFNKGYDAFDQETKNLWNGHMTFFRLVDHFTKPSLVKSVESAVVKNGQPLQIEQTLEMFKTQK
jgi:hypothetical protein